MLLTLLGGGYEIIMLQLRDSLYAWFLKSPWVVQPRVEPSDVQSQDNRFHQLLLPAQIMNTLTKLVVNNSIEDVERSKLVKISDEVYAQALQYHRNGDLGKVTKGEDVDAGQKALAVLQDSYLNNRNYFNRHYNAAAGLYFMKSVVIGVMQEWHQQRQGITDMIPPITWEHSADGHLPYDFKRNNTVSGGMHTNNQRFPFQKYVAHYMQSPSMLPSY